MSVSDRPSLFIHSLESERLGDGLGDGLGSAVLRSLSQRAVVLSAPQDTVIVDAMPDQAWLAFLHSIGLGQGEIITAGGMGESLIERVLTDDKLLARLRGKPWRFEPYMGGVQVQALAKAIGMAPNTPDVGLLNRLNLKSNLCPILGHAGLPTIPTTVCSREDTLSTAQHMFTEHGSVMVRSDLSIGGHGVWAITEQSDIEVLAQGVERAAPTRLFVLQPLLDVVRSPNVQFEIVKDGPRRVGISSQQMTQSHAFGGNEFPSPAGDDPAVQEHADILANWLHTAGYLGLVGIDFVITAQGNPFIVEVNPRVNTSTYPLLIAKRLGFKAFRLITGIQTPGIVGFEHCAAAIGHHTLFDRSTGAGAIPLVIPSKQREILDVMVFGNDTAQVDEISNQLQIHLNRAVANHRAVGGRT